MGEKAKSPEKTFGNDTTPGDESNDNETPTETATIIFQTKKLKCKDDDRNNDKTLPRNISYQQDQDKILQNYKLRLLKESYDEHLMVTDQRALKYTAQESRIILKDRLLYRQYYSKTGTV